MLTRGGRGQGGGGRGRGEGWSGSNRETFSTTGRGTSNTAKGTNTNKRVRIDPTSTGTNNSNTTMVRTTPKKTSPTQAANEVLKILTDPLHQAFATIILPLGKEMQDLRHRVFCKKNTLKMMEEEDDFIPKPAKVIITMTFSDMALKKLRPEWKTALETELKNATKTFQDSIKRIFILATKKRLMLSTTPSRTKPCN